MNRFLASLACAGALLSSGASRAQAPEPISIVVFGPPSLGAFLPPVIKAQKLDEKNGLVIKFEERTPDAYTAQFNSGEFQLGGSASLLTIGLADTRGVKVTYLFNLFDFWGAVVTSRPDVKTLRDLEGKDVAAAKGTTNYVMFDWFARQLGADPAKFSVINTATPGLIGYALADRAAAVQLWEPAYITLLSKKSDMRTIDLAIADSWKKFTGSSNIPYLGVAAHIDWVEKNPKLIPKLYATYKEAAGWVTAHPDDASKLIAAKGMPVDQKAIADLIRANDRLGMNVQWPRMSEKRSTRSTLPGNRSLSFPLTRPRRPSIRRPANERHSAGSPVVAAREHAVRGDKAAGVVGTAVRRSDPDLAIRFAVLPALFVSLADRCVLALP
jgi:NitT/TauT family transport system substrate-binding protein